MQNWLHHRKKAYGKKTIKSVDLCLTYLQWRLGTLDFYKVDVDPKSEKFKRIHDSWRNS